MVPSPLSCHFLGSPLRKTALLTEGCQKILPSFSGLLLWTGLTVGQKAMPRPHCHDHLISGRLPLHSDCVENTEARCSHRNRRRGRYFVCWLIRSTQIWNPSSMYMLVCSTHLMSIRPKMQEARERLKKTRSLCVACCLLGMFRSRQCRLPAMFLHFQVQIKHIFWQPCFTCPLNAGGVICQGASMLPTSYWHGCRLQLLFQTVLPTYKWQLVSLSVSCRLLSINSVQTSKDMSLEPVEFFRHICFLSAWKNLTFYQYRQGNSVKLCIFWVWRRPSYTGAVFNSSGARLRELCQWGGTKLSQGDFLLVWRVMLAHYHWNLVIHLCYRYWQTYFTRMSFRTCCWRGHLPGCFNAPHFLLTRVPSSTPFPNSLAYIQMAACLLICVLPAAFNKFCSNKQGHVTGTSWIFQTHLLPERMKESHFLSIQARAALPTRGQFSTRAVHDSGSCVSGAVPNWAKVIFFLCEELCWHTIIGT